MLTGKTQQRYDAMMTYIKSENKDGVTREELAELWGISVGMVGVVLAFLTSSGVPMPDIQRKSREKNGKYTKKNNYVDKENLGDPNMPLCPVCLKNGKRGRGYVTKTHADGTTSKEPVRVHLVYHDGETYCLECGYDPGYESYIMTRAKLAHFSRHREESIVAWR